MIKNRSAPPGPIVPILIYEDVSKAIDWLRDAFGFKERLRTAPEPDGTIHHAQLAIGGGAVILTGQRGGDRPPRSFVYVPVNNVDEHFERAKQFGARILSEPRNCEFGERQYSVEDLAGNPWTFSQSVADVKPEKWGATAVAEGSGLPTGARSASMVVEMRTYKTKPSQRSRFLEIFRAKSVPAHTAIGMKILGPFLSAEDPDSFFFMRGFPDMASREPMKARFYEGELWKGELENVLLPYVGKI